MRIPQHHRSVASHFAWVLTLEIAVTTLACGRASTLTNPPKRASFPLYVTIPGNAPKTGAIYKVYEPDEIDAVSEIVPILTGLDFPAGIAVDKAGIIYFTERPSANDGAVMRLDAEGGPPEVVVHRLADPEGLAVDSVGRIYVAETAADSVSLVHTDGSIDEILPGLRSPRGLMTDSEDNIFVVETGSGTVSKVIPDGTSHKIAEDLRSPVVAGPGLVGNTFYLVANSGLGDGVAVKVDDKGQSQNYLGHLVNPTSMDWEDSTVLYVAEGAPAQRIIKYSRVSGTRTQVAALPGEPHSIAFTPID